MLSPNFISFDQMIAQINYWKSQSVYEKQSYKDKSIKQFKNFNVYRKESQMWHSLNSTNLISIQKHHEVDKLKQGNK
jgi:hypothetical protein